MKKNITPLSGQPDFASRLEEIRQSLGYTHDKLAKAIEKPQSTVTRWLNRKEQPDLPNLIYVADKLSVSVDWLIGRSRVVAGVSLDQIEGMLRDIEKHSTWARLTPRGKLKLIYTFYGRSLGEEKTSKRADCPAAR